MTNSANFANSSQTPSPSSSKSLPPNLPRIEIHANFAPIMTNILFICLGNICRSCTAEEIFRTMVHKAGCDVAFHIDSAGLINYHEGELPDKRMRSHAADHGYYLTHRSRPITMADFDKFDLIIAMDERNRDNLLSMAPNEAARSKVVMMADYLQHHEDVTIIPDPYYGGAKGFELVIELLEDACEGLLLQLTAN